MIQQELFKWDSWTVTMKAGALAAILGTKAALRMDDMRRPLGPCLLWDCPRGPEVAIPCDLGPQGGGPGLTFQAVVAHHLQALLLRTAALQALLPAPLAAQV